MTPDELEALANQHKVHLDTIRLWWHEKFPMRRNTPWKDRKPTECQAAADWIMSGKQAQMELGE